MRRLFGCPDIVSLTEKFLMARNFYRIFTENKPVMGDSKTFGIPEAKGLKLYIVFRCLRADQGPISWHCLPQNSALTEPCKAHKSTDRKREITR